ELDYSTEQGGNKLFYIFYINSAGMLATSVADMNDQGGAQSGHPPAGAISPGGSFGPAMGAIAVVKTAGSPNYLISFEGGRLISREIGANEGDFTITGDLTLGFTPKAIVFDEDSQNLLLIPSTPNEDLLQVPFDTSTGKIGRASCRER